MLTLIVYEIVSVFDIDILWDSVGVDIDSLWDSVGVDIDSLWEIVSVFDIDSLQYCVRVWHW